MSDSRSEICNSMMDEKTPLLPHGGPESDAPTNTSIRRTRRPQRRTSMLLILSALGMLSLLIILRAYFYPIPIRLLDLTSIFTSKSTLKRPDSPAAGPTLDTLKHRNHHKHPITQLAHLPSHFTPTSTNNRRLLIVGDVHGSPHSLRHLLHETSFSLSHDHLILTGDIINKGPSTHGAVKLARKLGASCVRGNHEDKCLGLRGLGVSEQSVEAKVDISACTSDLSKKDLEYLAACPLILSLGQLTAFPRAKEVVVVHAGLVPGIKLEEQDPFAVMNMRAISRSHHRREKKKGKGKFVPEEGRNDGVAWFKVWNREQELLEGVMDNEKYEGEDEDESEVESGLEDGDVEHENDQDDIASKGHSIEPTIVVYGHDSKVGLNMRKWSKGLDSGCVGGGRLSGLLIDAEKAEVVSVKCKEKD